MVTSTSRLITEQDLCVNINVWEYDVCGKIWGKLKINVCDLWILQKAWHFVIKSVKKSGNKKEMEKGGLIEQKLRLNELLMCFPLCFEWKQPSLNKV